MLAADGRESQHHVKAGGGLLRRRREGRKRIAVFEIPSLDVTHGAVNMQAANVLVGIGLRQGNPKMGGTRGIRSEEHTSELQSRLHLVCRLLLEKKKKKNKHNYQ